MGDSDDGALESIECRLEMLPPLNVEVMQRLVQQEHIAASQHQQRELKRLRSPSEQAPTVRKTLSPPNRKKCRQWCVSVSLIPHQSCMSVQKHDKEMQELQ